MKIIKSPADQGVEEMDKVYDLSRRRFFKLAGGIAGAGVLLSSCYPKSISTNVYLGTGDTGLLNFLYVLEQIEAAFYTQAVATPYYLMDHLELLAITDVRDQEIAHKEYLQALLGNVAIGKIMPEFSTVIFTDRTSVLTNAAIIEDIVISGLNGAANLFTSQSYALAFSKMVSVEARHSAYFRDMLTPNSFGNSVIDINGLDQAVSPATALGNIAVYSQTKYDSSKLPK